jgi:hypothetical protein
MVHVEPQVHQQHHQLAIQTPMKQLHHIIPKDIHNRCRHPNNIILIINQVHNQYSGQQHWNNYNNPRRTGSGNYNRNYSGGNNELHWNPKSNRFPSHRSMNNLMTNSVNYQQQSQSSPPTQRRQGEQQQQYYHNEQQPPQSYYKSKTFYYEMMN